MAEATQDYQLTEDEVEATLAYYRQHPEGTLMWGGYGATALSTNYGTVLTLYSFVSILFLILTLRQVPTRFDHIAKYTVISLFCGLVGVLVETRWIVHGQWVVISNSRSSGHRRKKERGEGQRQA